MPACTPPTLESLPGMGIVSAYTSAAPAPAWRTVQSAVQSVAEQSCMRTAVEPQAVTRPLVSGLGVRLLSVKEQPTRDTEALPEGWPTCTGVAVPLKWANVTPAHGVQSMSRPRPGVMQGAAGV